MSRRFCCLTVSSQSTVGCVIKVDKASLRVIDQNGDARTVIPSQVLDKIFRRSAVATDRNGSEIRMGDTVKEIAGNTRTGIVLHIYRAFVFLHNREQTENSGVFVCRANNVATIVAKGGRVAQSTGPDLSKMNPAMLRNGTSGGATMMPPPARVGGRDRTIGQTVTIRQGPYKGLMGIIKDATDHTARVELHTKNKTVTIDKIKLGFREYANLLATPNQTRLTRGIARSQGTSKLSRTLFDLELDEAMEVSGPRRIRVLQAGVVAAELLRWTIPAAGHRRGVEAGRQRGWRIMMEEELQRTCLAERRLLGVRVMVVGRYTRATGRLRKFFPVLLPVAWLSN